MSGTRRKAIGSWEVALRLGTLARRRHRGWPSATAPARRVRSFLVKKAPAPAAHLLHLLDVRPRTLDEAREELERYDELEHPALPRIVEMFPYKRQLAVVVERDDGVRLDKLKGYLDRDRERLPDAAIWFVGWRLCSALAQAHLARDRRGDLAPILHGTLSSRDVLVEWDGDVKLHGLCPLLSAAPIAEGDEVSPPSRAWIGPGFRNGEPLTPRADTFAAALVLRGLLTGRPPPTPGASIEPLTELRPDIPADVARSLDRALHGRARPSAAELAQRLEGLVRILDGRRALLDCMELYQALWGLWSVASPQVWSTEAPPVLEASVGSFDPESAALSSLAPGDVDDAEIADELTLGDLDDVEPPPDTSRSAGASSTSPDAEAAASVPIVATSSRPEDESEGGDDGVAVSLATTMASVPDEPVPPQPRELSLEGDEGSEPGARERADGRDEGPGRGLVPPSMGDEPSEPLPRPPRTPLASTTESVPDEPDKARWPLYLVAACLVALVAWYASRDRNVAPEGGQSASTAEVVPSGAPTAPTRAAAAPRPTSDVVEEAPSPSPIEATTEDDPPGDVPPEVVVQPTLSAEERADMEWTQGYLLVESELRDALVYVNGHRVGPVGRKNKIFCGRKFVRLGTENPPTTPWLTGGTTVELACRDLTVVSIAGPH